MKKLLLFLFLIISLNLFSQTQRIKIQTNFNHLETNYEKIFSSFDYSKFIQNINENFIIIKRNGFSQYLKHKDKDIWLIVIYSKEFIIYNYFDSKPY